VTAARQILAKAPSVTDALAIEGTWENGPYMPFFETDVAIDDWAAALGDAQSTDEALRAAPGAADPRLTYVRPKLALALQMNGRAADASATIAATPLDCDFCLWTRGRISALQGNWRGATAWFDRAARLAPSLPFPHLEWGRALLAKGDLDGAIRELSLAHEKSPRFADPLELWGEALFRKDNFEGAASKFAQAAALAQRWGRCELLWGEALAKLGRADEAAMHYRAATGMDLSAADRATLQGVVAKAAF
jgi:tetratricopeptide (TPR) repeat protein